MKSVVIAIAVLASLNAFAEGWTVLVGPNSGAPVGPNAVAVDSDGNVLAAGGLDNGLTDLTVVKLARHDGTEIWRYTVADPGNSLAWAVVVDSSDDVLVAGTIDESDIDFFVAKLSGETGREVWRYTINEWVFDRALALAVDSENNVVAAGGITLLEGGIFAVVKLSALDGRLVWRQDVVDGTAWTIAIDAGDDVVASGNTHVKDGESGIFTAKLDGATGAILWTSTLHVEEIAGGTAWDVAIDPEGDAVLAGQLDYVGPQSDSFVVVKLSGSSGVELWRRLFHGTASGDNNARAVAVDRRGDVLAVGDLRNENTAQDGFVVKLSGLDGATLWQSFVRGNLGTAFPSDWLNAITLDAQGNAVVAGSSLNVGGNLDFTIAKLDSDGGKLHWKRNLTDGPSSDEARAVALDSHGDVVAAGHIGGVFAVAKVLGESGNTTNVAPSGVAPFFGALGTIAGTQTNTLGISDAHGVSPDGRVVVGKVYHGGGVQQAFKWTSEDGMVGLGQLPGGSFSSATDVSADGRVIVGGAASPTGATAIRWTSEDGMVPLKGLPPAPTLSGAVAVSWEGTVIAGRISHRVGTEVIRWSLEGGLEVLGDLPGGSLHADAFDISRDGTAIAGRGVGVGGQHAFRWTIHGGFEDLGELPGGSNQSWGFGISPDGKVVVGQSQSSLGAEPFVWIEGQGMKALGDLPGGEYYGAALACSNSGRIVVGGSVAGVTGITQYDRRAFLWTPAEGMRSLQTILETDYGLDLAGWTLLQAVDISADGHTIVGEGLTPGGKFEGWIARIPEGEDLR